MVQLLSPEQVANADTDPAQYVEASRTESAPVPPTPAIDLLQGIRIGWRDLAQETAHSISHLSQATVEQVLEIGQKLLRVQKDLKKKEYPVFLSVLGWTSTKARKFINLAKTFAGFELKQLIGIDITTLLSLCSKRYAGVVAQLREVAEITNELIEQLIKDNRTSKKPNLDPISGWKRSRSGGGRFYNLLIHSEEVGLSIESQAAEDNILPQRVIAEAVALRAIHKSSAKPTEYRADKEPQEQQTTVEVEALELEPEHIAPGQELDLLELKAIEHQAADENILPFRVIEEALALSAIQNSSVKPTEYRADTQPEAQQATVEALELEPDHTTPRQELDLLELKTGDEVDSTPTLIAADGAVKASEAVDESGLVSEAVDEIIAPLVTAGAPQETPSIEVEATEVTAADTEPAQHQSQVFAPAPEFFHSPTTEAVPQPKVAAEPMESPAVSVLRQDTVALLPDESATTTMLPESGVASVPPEPVNDMQAVATKFLVECPVIRPAWDMLNQIRDGENYLREIETQIEQINSKLARHDLTRQVERELKGVLQNRQKLRSNKISQIVNLADTYNIPADYEALRTQGRVVLEQGYAEKLLRRAKTWPLVARIVGSDKAQFIKLVKDWEVEEKLVLVEMLSTYLKTEAGALNQIDWLPKTLLEKALSTLSFTLNKIASCDNLVDEAEFEYLHGFKFVSVEKLGTRDERWLFIGDGESFIPMFGRSDFSVENV